MEEFKRDEEVTFGFEPKRKCVCHHCVCIFFVTRLLSNNLFSVSMLSSIQCLKFLFSSLFSGSHLSSVINWFRLILRCPMRGQAFYTKIHCSITPFTLTWKYGILYATLSLFTLERKLKSLVGGPPTISPF